MKLYTYFRSSAAYRVRIALNLKGLEWESIPIHLLRGGGEQLGEAYRRVHPGALVPALEHDGHHLTQSLAIIEYLDELYPEPALLPGPALARARIRSLSQAIACDIHPLNNLRVLRYLVHSMHVDEEGKNKWYRHWLGVGFTALEAQLRDDPATGQFCHGETPTMADCCLVPQVANARRFNLDMNAFPTVLRIDEACAQLPAFADAAPSRQPDAE
ncbi:MAG: maleylacetoacetate isomerase [Gammaproteobacteria bacterium]